MAISQARFKEVVCYSSIALLALAITAGPWVITVALQAPDYWNYFSGLNMYSVLLLKSLLAHNQRGSISR